jgi:N-acetylmuramoyl-L-alanine amidase
MIYRADIIPGDLTKKLYPMVPKRITVHTTRNLEKGADAESHARFLKGIDISKKCWHVTVDDKEAIQHIPFNLCAWSCGDGEDGTGNRTSIQVEICENEDGDFQKAVANAQKKIRDWMKEFNIPLSEVHPHKKWSGKDCPHVLLPVWDKFLDGLKEQKKAHLHRVQVGAFQSKENAENLQRELKRKGYPAIITE